MTDLGSTGCMVTPDCKGLTPSYCLILWSGDLAGEAKVMGVSEKNMCLVGDQTCSKSSHCDHSCWVS